MNKKLKMLKIKCFREKKLLTYIIKKLKIQINYNFILLIIINLMRI